MGVLTGKIVIVTGGAAGIGAGVTQLFAEEGAHVYAVDLDEAQMQKSAEALRAKGGSVSGFCADARDRKAMAKVVDAAIAAHGRIDALINVAGIYPRQTFVKMTEEEWDTMQDINVKSVFHCTQLVMPHMVKQGGGAVVNISSVTFFTGLEHLTHYITSKGAIIGFTRALSREMGAHNIRVNCITPGAIETEGERRIMSKEESDRFMIPQSLKRRIQPLEIARVCLFLASDLSSAMTGQTLNVDGGWILH